MRKLLNILVLFFVSFSVIAASNSNPGLYYGQVPTAAQWNSYFSSKLDYSPGANNNLPYWDGSGNLVAAPVTGSCTFTAGTFDCATENLDGGTIGAIPYQSAPGVTSFLSGNTTTTPQFVTSTGTGAAAQAPTLTGSTGTGTVVLSSSLAGSASQTFAVAAATTTTHALRAEQLGLGLTTKFIANGTFTTSANISTATVFEITLVGAGNNGGASTVGTIGGGGGAGGAVTFWITGLSPSTGYTVSVGTTAGASTSIVINAVTYEVTGGTVGSASSATGVTAAQGSPNAAIVSGGAVQSYVTYYQTESAGQYIATTPDSYHGSNGGTIPFGGGGMGAYTGNGNGAAAKGYGGGGGGSGGAGSAGAFSPGMALISYSTI